MTPEVPVFGVPAPGALHRVRPAAYAVVFDPAGRVACVEEESGLYLPGGGIEPGEDAARALEREVAEECARAVVIDRRLGEAIQFYRSARGEAFELRATFYLARFGAPLERVPQHRLWWHRVSDESPSFFHACHRWAVQQGMRERGS